MSFALSPGVTVVETDITTIIPAVSTSVGAFAGQFQWGPVLDPTTVSSENDLVARFGGPNDSTFRSFFSAANFLGYTNNLIVVRTDAEGYKSACQQPGAGPSYLKIKNKDQYQMDFSDLATVTYGSFAAKYPGSLGNGIQVILVDSAVWTYADAHKGTDATAALVVKSFTGAPTTSAQARAIGVANDELHVLILDNARGSWTGTPGAVLEKFEFLSKIKGVTKSDGTNVFWVDAISNNSKYVWALCTPASAMIDNISDKDWTESLSSLQSTDVLQYIKILTDSMAPAVVTLSGGADDFVVVDGDIEAGYDLLTNAETYDISLVVTGAASKTVANYVIDNLVEVRKDCVAFISPNTDGEPIIATGSDGVDAITTFTADLSHSSYAVVDTGWKYQYDRYNDKYRWVPLNADLAGLCARTDYTTDPWFSPGGLNRGQIKNVVKLGFSPDKTSRDNLYIRNINPVVTFPGQGTILYGDKTFTAKPSAFDRINVRRLFIVLEKAIARAAKYQLFEFNDDFTRAQFRSMTEPFLRGVQGRRGITDFRVKCDATNNTAEVIDSNNFVADIFIKPNRSINFITLNFVAARSGVSFSEIGG
jgi:phage tail sheath protein FI